MGEVGVLIVAYGSRGAAFVDLLDRSSYDVDIYVADKQANPFNIERARKHVVIPDLHVQEILKFAKQHQKGIDFGLVGPEDPIINGVRDVIENETNIKMLCPTQEYAIEGSKVKQRELISRVCPEVNPRYRVFDPSDYRNQEELRDDVYSWLDELNNQVAVKPDGTAKGKGVGVWGDHFLTREDIFDHTLSIYNEGGKVIIEEKIDGEEFSGQFFSDGERLIATPVVRDYKRSFDGYLGPNTGGMGSYKDTGDILPFMTLEDYDASITIANKLFNEMKGDRRNENLLGLVMYNAYVISKYGVKIFEINSRPGDPEWQNLAPLLEGDIIDVCENILKGDLSTLNFKELASVVIYAVPLTYGGYRKKYSGPNVVDLTEAEKLKDKYGDRLKIYPGALYEENGKLYAVSSRTVAMVGIADTIPEAREISLEAITNTDGPLRNRDTVASQKHIQDSIEHRERLGGE